MILRGARVALGARESGYIDLYVARGRVNTLVSKKRSRVALDLSGFLILPGLINAHDHLEFNLFPRLGNGIYNNATSWAKDIYRPNQAPIRQHLGVPKTVRLLWGGIKNLLSGVTSVSHHNTYQPSVFDRGFPLRVPKHFGWAHSLRFCSDTGERFRRTPPGAPFIIHACEGKDSEARNEIDELHAGRLLGPSTVIVHAVAIEAKEIALLKENGVSVIWCPTSNYFTLGRTLPNEAFESGIPIALGSDSALTAAGDFLDELRVALKHVTADRLYDMVTRTAAQVLRLQAGEGSIRNAGVADLLVISDNGQQPADALFSICPHLVMIGGRIKLLSPEMARHLGLPELPGFEQIELEGRGRWFIDYPLAALLERTATYLGHGFRLAGKKVFA